MMRPKLLLNITLLFALCVTSCSDKIETGPIAEYEESDLTQSFSANEISTSYFNFTASEPWTVDLSAVTKSDGDDDLWIEVSPMSGGAGEHQLEITINAKNITGESRSVEITITGESGESPITISVTQSTTMNIRILLEEIYNSTGGDNWTNNTNWCTDAALSEWYGVSYSNYGKIILNLGDNNLIGDLDISGCSSLETLNCWDNQLTTLDVSGCSSLTTFSCSENQLTTLDVSGLSSLVQLECQNNQLTTLDVSGCSRLWLFSCVNNQLTTLDVSGLSSLWYLQCGNNQLTTLDVSGLSSLETLGCYSNQLTTLDVSECGRLSQVECQNNQLTTLDVSGCSRLEVLFCYSNQLTTLDISGCSSLWSFSCVNNQLTSLYLSSDPTDYFYYSLWGDYDPTIYTEPSHKDGYQYPVFYYK